VANVRTRTGRTGLRRTHHATRRRRTRSTETTTRIHACRTGSTEKTAFLASQLIWSQQVSTLTAKQILCDRTLDVYIEHANELSPDPPRLRAILAHLDKQLAENETVGIYLSLQRDAVRAALARAEAPPLRAAAAPR
jgi:hypothetical protein